MLIQVKHVLFFKSENSRRQNIFEIMTTRLILKIIIFKIPFNPAINTILIITQTLTHDIQPYLREIRLVLIFLLGSIFCYTDYKGVTSAMIKIYNRMGGVFEKADRDRKSKRIAASLNKTV